MSSVPKADQRRAVRLTAGPVDCCRNRALVDAVVAKTALRRTADSLRLDTPKT